MLLTGRPKSQNLLTLNSIEVQQPVKTTTTPTQRRKTTDAVLTVGQPISMQMNAKTNWGEIPGVHWFLLSQDGGGTLGV